MKYNIQEIKGRNGDYCFKYRPWQLAVAVIFTDVNNNKWQLAIACETSHYTEKVAGDIEEIFPLLNSMAEIAQLYKDCVIYKDVFSKEGRQFTVVYDNIDADSDRQLKNKIFIKFN